MENKTNTLSTDEMWTTLRKAPDFVLDGYDVPRLYIDAVKQKKQRELTERVEDQIRSPKKYWPVKKDDQIVVFKRPNYLDDIFKLANSYYDKEKAEKVMEKLSNKEKSDDNKGNTIPKLYKHDRYSYFDDLIKVEKKKFDYYNFREEIIKDASEKKKAYEDKKDKIESDKLKGIINTEGGHDYKKFGSLPKSDRITILEDIVHSAEQIPFCKQIETIPKMIEITDDKGKKKQVENFERLDYPKKKVILSQSPKWSFGKVVSKTEEQIAAIDKRKEDLITKIEKIRESVINRNKTRPNILNEDLRNSFIAVDNYKKIIGPSLVKSTPLPQQYFSAKEARPQYQPGPQHYWKEKNFKPMKKTEFKGREDLIAPTKEEYKIEENGKVNYYFPRKRTDMFVSKPMKSHIF